MERIDVKAKFLDIKDGKYALDNAPNYSEIIALFGNPAIEIWQNDYQGDTWVLYDSPKFGYLSFGWGSCSGCDALESCTKVEELQQLVNELQDSIQWFDSKESAAEWFKNRDWQGQYSWGETDFKKFLKEVEEYFG